jgi:hypothetical protein
VEHHESMVVCVASVAGMTEVGTIQLEHNDSTVVQQ